MPVQIPQTQLGRRTVAQEKVWINQKTNFHYICRGIERTPPGTTVKIVQCNSGLMTEKGVVKGTITLGLTNGGQRIAWSLDPDDLILFAMDQGWPVENESEYENWL